MRVEAIVKEGGLFIPNPGIFLGRKKHIFLDITPVTSSAPTDAFVQAAGLLKTAAIDGVAFQKKIRTEWENR